MDSKYRDKSEVSLDRAALEADLHTFGVVVEGMRGDLDLRSERVTSPTVGITKPKDLPICQLPKAANLVCRGDA